MNRQTSAHRGSFGPQPHTAAITSEPTPTLSPRPARPRRLRTPFGICAVVATAAAGFLGHDTLARAQPPNPPTATTRVGTSPNNVATRDVATGGGATDATGATGATRANAEQGADARGSASAGAGTGTGADAAAVAAAAWLAGGGQAEIASLEDDFAHLVTDARSAPGTATTRFAQDCAQLAGDASAAQHAEPIPDPQAQTSWSKALGAMHTGADACLVGAVRTDTAQLNQGLAQAAAGTTDIHDAAVRFQELITPAHP